MPARARARSGAEKARVLQRLQQPEGVAAADEDRLGALDPPPPGGRRRRASSTATPSRCEPRAELRRVAGAIGERERHEEDPRDAAPRSVEHLVDRVVEVAARRGWSSSTATGAFASVSLSRTASPRGARRRRRRCRSGREPDPEPAAPARRLDLDPVLEQQLVAQPRGVARWSRPKRSGSGTETIVPIIDSGTAERRSPARAGELVTGAPRQLVVVGADRVDAELGEHLGAPSGAASQADGSRVPTRSNSCVNPWSRPHEITVGCSPRLALRARPRGSPQLRGAHAHLCRLPTYQSTPSAGRSSAIAPGACAPSTSSGTPRARQRAAISATGSTSALSEAM